MNGSCHFDLIYSLGVNFDQNILRALQKIIVLPGMSDSRLLPGRYCNRYQMWQQFHLSFVCWCVYMCWDNNKNAPKAPKLKKVQNIPVLLCPLTDSLQSCNYLDNFSAAQRVELMTYHAVQVSQFFLYPTLWIPISLFSPASSPLVLLQYFNAHFSNPGTFEHFHISTFYLSPCNFDWMFGGEKASCRV